MQYGFYVDSARCVGCKTCQVACKDENDTPVGALFRRVHNYEDGDWAWDGSLWRPANMVSYQLSVSCNHCASPACVANCPSGAMQKDDETGIVTSDPEVCIGCQTCVRSCPYGAPQYLGEEASVIGKCDGCRERRAAGLDPRCVTVCPTRALEFDDLKALRERHPGLDALVEPLPDDGTDPSLLVNPHLGAPRTGQGAGTSPDFIFELGNML